MDFIHRAGRGSAKKEQGEKSCIVSHNNLYFHRQFYIILQTLTDCDPYEQIKTQTKSSARTATAQ